MTPFRILIADGLEANGQAILGQAALVDDLNGISAEELVNRVSGYDALLVRSRTKVTRAVLEAAARLKVVGRAGVGVDNIDLAAAREHGVMVVNAPQSTSLAVAELALGMMLSLARLLPLADRTMKAGEWQKNKLKGSELNGKTLGIVGMGRIGETLGRMASALGMHITGHDPYLSPEALQAKGAAPAASLEDLYAQADYISYHVPLTPETRGSVGADAFARMKPGVRIICTARGGVINEQALLDALENGQVAGAALDVFNQEPPGLTPLVAHPRVLATPHIGAQTEEAQTRAAEDIATEILAALNGQPLRWRVR